jgi:O-antigen/teichoic acid export membrane protein
VATLASERRIPAVGARVLPRGWQVYAMFGALPVAWFFGLANFVWPVVGIVLFLNLLARKGVAAPRFFGVWLLFLGWMLLSALALESGDRLLAFLYRGSLYLAATALFLYLFNAPEHRIPSRAIVNSLAIYWAAVVVGGFLGLAFPGMSFQTLAEQVIRQLAPGLLDIAFIHDIVHPGFAQVQRILGFPVGRPKTFFTYTNEWGSTLVLLTPFALLAVLWARSFVARYALALLLILSIVPLAVSLNRGAWIALLVMLVYVALRLIGRRNVRALGALVGLAALLGAILVLSPLGGLIQTRIATPHSDKGRETRDATAIQLVTSESPVIGFGAPQPSDDPTAPAIGTHGQLFLVLISQGIPGFALFFGWFLYVLWRTRRSGSPIRFWAHVVILTFLVLSPFYELVAFQLPIVMAAMALAWRELSPPPAVVRGPAAGVRRPRPLVPPGSFIRSRARLSARRRGLATRTPARDAVPAPDEVSRELRRSDLTTVARGGALSLVGGIAFGVLGFLLVLAVSHGFGAGGAGLFFEAVALFMIASRVSQFGAEVGVIRELPRLRALELTSDTRRVLLVALIPVLVVASAIALAFSVFAPDLARLVVREGSPEEFASFIRIWSPFIVLAALSAVVLAAARGLGSLVPFVSIENVGKPAFQLLLAVGVIAAGLGTTAIAVSWTIPIALGFLAAIAWLLAILRRVERQDGMPHAAPRPMSELARGFWRFSAPRGVAGMFQVIVAWSDILLVGALASAYAAGIYAAVSRFAVVGTLVLRALIVSIGPQISSLLARNLFQRAQTVYQTSTWWLTAASWPLYILLAVFSPLFLRVFGEEFTAGHTALTILASAMLVSMACGPVSVVLLMSGKSSWNLYNTVVSASVGVGLNILLVPKYGIEGAAVASAAAVILNNLLPLVQVRLHLRLHPLGSGFFVVAVSTLATYGGLGILARALAGPTASALIISAALATVVYVALLWRFRGMLHLDVLREMMRLRRIGPDVGQGAVDGPG